MTRPKTHKREIACPFYDLSIAFSGLFEKMESFVGFARVVLGEAARGNTDKTIALRRRWSKRRRDVKCNIHHWRFEHSEEGGGERGKEGEKIEGTKVEASKSGSKMQTSWKIVKAKTLQM